MIHAKYAEQGVRAEQIVQSNILDDICNQILATCDEGGDRIWYSAGKLTNATVQIIRLYGYRITREFGEYTISWSYT